MKNIDILDVSGGMDVVTAESNLPAGRVRKAENIVIHNEGQFERRDGATLSVALTQPHSLFVSTLGTFCMAAGTLYRLTGNANALTATSVASGFSGFARYAELAGSLYVTTPNKLARVDPDVTVWQPGVASLLGVSPVLSATAGGLDAGRYGVAFSAVNSLGEESGMSDIAFIDLAASGGIAVALPPAIGDAVSYRLYRTTRNGDVLYMVSTFAVTTSTTIAGGEVSATERGLYGLDCMPPGAEITALHSRLLVAIDRFVIPSQPFMPGLTDPRADGVAFPAKCDRLLVGVEGGAYVGTDDAIYFLEGAGPSSWKFRTVAGNGAVKHSGRLVDAALLDDKYAGSKEKHAVWLSQYGWQIGRPDGTVVSPQNDRIFLAGVPRAPSTIFALNGVKQLIAATQVLTLGRGGAIDTVQ